MPRVLVVDDDHLIRSFICDILRDEGLEVFEAADGAEALAIVSATRPDVILLDLIMPVMDGAAFVASYRRQGGQPAPIIVVSAGTEAGERAQELDAAGFLAKPFTLRALIQTVNDLTANPSRTLQLTH